MAIIYCINGKKYALFVFASFNINVKAGGRKCSHFGVTGDSKGTYLFGKVRFESSALLKVEFDVIP